jgi:tetratricopeptide (TPR) repeat protein
MATVYRALDRRLGRTVALKVIHPELTHLLGADRFHREVSIAAALQHDNIVSLYEAGDDGGLLYFTMPLVEGETLRARLEREGQLEVDAAVRIAEDVAAALGCAHQHGVIHRDIKPENILLKGDRAMVTDFGIARAITEAGEDRLTSAGIAVGTPAYMSPEQGSCKAKLDGRADIYALGCVLYEMLGGEPPFTGATAQAVVARQMQEAPRSLRVVRPAVSLALQDVVEKALAKVPADRYPTAGDFTAALERAKRQPRGTIVKWGWRHRSVVAASLLVLIAVALVARFAIGRSAYADGVRAFERWDLGRAQRMFRRAVAADPSNAEAHLWLAQAAVLEGTLATDWRASARSAVAYARRLLTPRDSALAFGLLFLADSQYTRACGVYDSALARDTLNVLAWFGLGECRRRDVAVVPDRRSATGWRFRSSYQGAAAAYLRALEIAPSLSLAFGPSAYDRLSTLLVAEPIWARPGVALPPDTGLFVAYPALDHDTLLLVPHRAADRATPEPTTSAAAVAKGRRLLSVVVTRWVDAFPRSAQAHSALARVLELRGQLVNERTSQRSALSEIGEALRLEVDPTLRLRDALNQIRLELKLAHFGHARALSDSILAANPDPDSSSAWYLACASALVGRAHRTAELFARTASDTSFRSLGAGTPEAPPQATVAALRLLAYASLGAPVESLAAIEQQVDTALRRYAEPEERERVRHELQDNSGLLGFPARGLRPAARPSGTDWLSVSDWLLARGDTAAARAELKQAQREQTAFGPSSLIPEFVYLQAWLSVAVQDTAGAEWLLDLLLNNLAAAPTMLIGEPQQAGTLVRAMALRAQVAWRRHDRAAARQWAARVDTLWSQSDLPELRSLVAGLAVP